MRVCIHSDYLGSERHLLSNSEGQLGWSGAIPEDAWVLGPSVSDSVRDVRVLASIAGDTASWDLPERFLRADEEASVDKARHLQTVPRRALLAHVCDVLSRARSMRSLADDSYITGWFLETRRQLGDVCAGYVDHTEWSRLMADESNPTLASFEHEPSGLMQPVVYEQLGSITGRLTVASGPQILTLKREHRSVIRSSRRGRRLLMVDFVSHEPRVALGIKGDVAPDDIYEWFRSEHAPACTRDQAKQAVIGTLYGMSAGTLGEKTDTTLMQARVLSEAVRVAFGLRALEAALISEHRASGRVRSHFGREITPSSAAPGVLINSFIQSSAFDIAMAGFRHIIDLLASQIVEAKVFFYIHDAMIFEVSERDEEAVRSVLSGGISIPGCPGIYKVKVKEVTE